MNWRYLAVGTVCAFAATGLALGALVSGTFRGDSVLAHGTVVGSATAIAEDDFIGSYAIETGDGGALLVDAGTDPEATLHKAWLAERGMGPEHVRAVFLTHGHFDHIGGCGAFPEATVIAMAEEKGIAEGTEKPGALIPAVLGRGVTCPVDHLAADGESFTFGERTVTGYHLPGHTPGSAAWLIDGVLFLGDAASASTSGEVTAPKWLFSNDQDEGLRSLEALGARLHPTQVQWLAFAHTGPLEGLEPLRRVNAP